MPSPRTWRQKLTGLVLSLGICLAVSAAGGAVTATSVGTWYQALHKPAFNPPDWMFAPVWTALYVLMAIAAWRVWATGERCASRKALLAYAAQLALNLGWSILFFGLRMIGPALVEIVVLLIAILATTVLFWRIDRPAGLMFVPYAAWVAFATLLTASLWRLN